ncbi:LysR substrate-binding domain-containing protein [Roseixanthobacter glucoisosaccharinicivorans]|uniref:LysR substrate-binding domain-containing protein n=1 Tax=Roseixanthobacter glucoisosaccharinicivorans TaxID=3119923 RepID=UPI00372BE304
MLDLDLLRAFVSVVDAGGFTRAGERVHRTQSTVSQQIRRLEEAAGCAMFHRAGRGVRLTEEGERLIGYARRILALSTEAKAALRPNTPQALVRVGIPDDFALVALTRTVAAFARMRPDVRLSVRCGMSRELAADLARGDLDVALLKREPGPAEAMAVWPEHLVWIAAADHPIPALAPVPLVAFPQGCIYRNRAIHALEAAGLAWRIAYESPNLMGLQAALAGGLGIALLERRSLTTTHRLLGAAEGLPDVPPGELALCLAPGVDEAGRALAGILARFCDTATPAELAA